MIASDVPQARWADGDEMIRCLVKYMDNPRAVQVAVREHFPGSGCIVAIEKARAEYLANKGKPQAYNRLVGEPTEYDADDTDARRDALNDINRRFVQALELERQGGVRSMGPGSYLKNPAMVNEQMERYIAGLKNARA